MAEPPRVHPLARTLGDAEMLLNGSYAPQTDFGGAIPLDDEVQALVDGAGSVILVDDEGTSVAEVARDGTLRPLAHPASGTFRALHLSPMDVGEPEGERWAVLLDRPLLADEVSRLQTLGTDADVVLLVRTLDTLVPADVLVRCAVAASRTIARARVVAVPFARRDDAAMDARLRQQVLRNYHARPLEQQLNATAWRAVRRALDGDDEDYLSAHLDPGTLAVLRSWRPPRSARGLVVFFTGLSGSGKSTIARGLVDRLHEIDRTVTVLDGDVARRMLSAGLGFSRQDRDLNIRRLGWVGAEVARHGGVAVLAPIAPFAGTRAEVRRMVEAHGDLVLVWVSTPLAECERRDRKGLYAAARRGEIPDFTGISSPYEEPTDADVVLDTTTMTVDDAVAAVREHLSRGGWVRSPDP